MDDQPKLVGKYVQSGSLPKTSVSEQEFFDHKQSNSHKSNEFCSLTSSFSFIPLDRLYIYI